MDVTTRPAPSASTENALKSADEPAQQSTPTRFQVKSTHSPGRKPEPVATRRGNGPDVVANCDGLIVALVTLNGATRRVPEVAPATATV